MIKEERREPFFYLKGIKMKVKDYRGAYIEKKCNHMYIAPAEELKDMIAHYTITYPEDELECDVYHIVPDASGCLIFKDGELDYWGAMSEVVLQKNDLNEEKERFFVEFLPGGLYQLSGQNQQEFVNHREDFALYNQQLKIELVKIYEQANTYEDLIEKLNAFFIMRREQYKLPNYFKDILALIELREGNISMREISELYQLSQRKLVRDFHKYIGFNGKQFTNIVRINSLLAKIKENPLTDIAMQGGYFDQTHFNKMFKQITNTTPKKYLANVSDFYYEIFKF